MEKQLCSTPGRVDRDMFCGGSTQNLRSVYAVALTVPGPPTEVLLTNRTDTTISLAWTPPPQSRLLTQYTISAQIVHTFTNYSLTPPEWVVAGISNSIEMVNLRPATFYNFTIVAESANGPGGSRSFSAQTEIGRPDPQPEQPKIVSQTDTTRTIEIRPAINWNGPISWYRVLVIIIDSAIVRDFDESLLGDFQKAQEDGSNFYVAAELEPFDRPRRFTVGDGQVYRGYLNAALPAGAHVHIAVGVVSEQDGLKLVRYAETSHEQHDVVIAIQSEDDEGEWSRIHINIT